MSDITRKRLYVLLSESVNKKKDNNIYLTSKRYNSLLNEVKEAKSVKGKQAVHYRRLKRYDILNGAKRNLVCHYLQKKQKSCTMLILTNCST